MKKDLGVQPAIYPMPVVMIATYDENEKVDVMNMAWGGICANNMVALNIREIRKTVKNMKLTNAFTLAIADVEHVAEADYFGIVSGNTVEDKFEKTGLHAIKSEKVNAPIIEEFPVTLECEVVAFEKTVYGHRVLGKIINVMADEKVLDENSKIDVTKLNALIFDQCRNDYYTTGKKIASAWNVGKKFNTK